MLGCPGMNQRPESFAAAIRAAREAAGISQVELARRMGMDQSAINRIESGRRAVSEPTMWRVATALGLSMAELVQGGPRDLG